MVLCTLHPSITNLVCNLELADKIRLAAVAAQGNLLPAVLGPETVTFELCGRNEALSPAAVSSASVSQILGELGQADTTFYSEQFLTDLQKKHLLELLSSVSPASRTVKVAPKTIKEMLNCWDDFGKQFGKSNRSRDLHQRVESQILDWTSNFYARLRGKRVLVLAGLNPLIVAGSFISDIVRKIGAVAPELEAENDLTVVDWDFIRLFAPHTILFAPLDKSLKESQKLFFDLEKLTPPESEIFKGTPAMKRGEVFFAEGTSNFYNFDYRILKTLSIIVSACAGFESGYISERDIFYKLRHLELHRHKI